MKKYLIPLVIAASFALVSCKEDPQVSISEQSLEMGYKGGSFSFDVTANDTWKIVCSSDNPDLFLPRQWDGEAGTTTVTVDVHENTSTSILKHHLTVVSPNIDLPRYKSRSHITEKCALVSLSLTQGAPAYVKFSKSAHKVGYTGGEYKFSVSANFPWEITVEGEGITVEPTSGVPVEEELDPVTGKPVESEDDEQDAPGTITVTIDDYEGDTDREFILTVTARGDDATVTDQMTITQERPMLVVGNLEYPIKKMADGRWWMVQNLCYSQKGITIGDGRCGIWYPCSDNALEFDNTTEGILAKGLIYADFTVFNTNITSTTSKQQEGAQGICPKGWHIPTLNEMMALVGKCTDSKVPVNADAPYYDAAKGHGSLSKLEEGGFNTSMAGYVMGRDKGFASNGTIQGYNAARRYVESNYIFSSTAYLSGSSTGSSMWYALVFNKTANTADVTMMSNSTAARPFAGSVRCIKDE